METGSESAALGATEPAAGAKVPATLRDPGAIRFWIAVVLTGLCAGLGAALLTLLFDAAQEIAWGAAEPSALFEAARQASPGTPHRFAARRRARDQPGSMALTRLTSGNGIDVTAAIWFQAGRMPAWRTLGTAVLSIVIVGHGRSARPRRRPQAVRGGVRQSVLEPSEALGRTAASDRRDRRRRRHGRGL